MTDYCKTPHNPIVEFENVDFAYNGKPAVESATFSIGEKELVSIVGPNGGGKTTLLRLMLGILQPDAGRIEVLGATPAKARRRVGYMPQHLQYDRHFPITVGDVVLMGRLEAGWRGFYGPNDRRLARRALAEMGLEDLWDRHFTELSGGQRQRVLIARALACEPRILLLDEPTANVDAGAEAQLVNLLQRLRDRMSVVLVSHDLGFVSKSVEKVVCVNRTVVCHPTAELTGDMIQQIYESDVRMVRHDHHIHQTGSHAP